MDKLYLQIISPKKVLYDGECSMLEYTTSEGQVGILPGHIAMTQIIEPGVLTIYGDGEKNTKVFAMHSGLVRIMPDLVTILPEVIEAKNEIDVVRAQNALDRADKRLNEKSSTLDLNRARLAKRRAETRLKVANL